VSSASRSTDTPSSGLRAHGTCWFGPRVRLSDDPTQRSYTSPVTAMTTSRMLMLAAMTRRRLAAVIHRLP